MKTTVTYKRKLREIVDAEVDGIEMWDYPDFCDAYLSAATWADTGIDLTDEELEEVNSENGDVVYELVQGVLY